jgi:hypothetical protein
MTTNPSNPKRALVFHDIQPMLFSFKPLLTKVFANHLAVYDGGSEHRPAEAPDLQTFVAGVPQASAIVAKYTLPVIDGPATAQIRSVVPLVHPMVRMVNRIEHAWKRLADAQPERASEAASLGVIVGKGLSQPFQRYPFADFHGTFLSAALNRRTRPEPAALAALLVERAAVCLLDHPETIMHVLRAELGAAGAGLKPKLLEGRIHAPPTVESLRRWAEEVPVGVWNRMLALNAADLDFYDEIVALLCVDERLPAPLRETMREQAEAARESTTQRTAPPGSSQASGNGAPAHQSLAEPDPVLGWRYRPDQQIAVDVLGESVTIETDATGYRPVPGQPAEATHTLTVYGCSCVFGWGVPAEQTFCALLQQRMEGWRIDNRGVNGYGTGQNLLQLMREVRWNGCDYVTFCWIPAHLSRNVADLLQVQRQTERCGTEKAALIKFMPRACLDEKGEISFREVAYAKPELVGLDLSDFTPDMHYLDHVCLALFKRAAALVAEHGGRFFVTVLLDELSSWLRQQLDQAGIAVVDASVKGPMYVNPFELSHPNAKAQEVYADRIGAYLQRQVEESKLA